MPVPRLVNKIGISRYMELPTNDLGALSPAEVRIPLRQHIGAPAQAVVKVGDRVKCGDVIGEIPEQVSAPVSTPAWTAWSRASTARRHRQVAATRYGKGRPARPLTKKERPCV